ncbi:hypothetical protein J6590_088340 [Homalodisca vitripennis]|nr:hypothetical protein J6590_088340 [Homalodisca vitripennis]
MSIKSRLQCEPASSARTASLSPTQQKAKSADVKHKSFNNTPTTSSDPSFNSWVMVRSAPATKSLQCARRSAEMLQSRRTSGAIKTMLHSPLFVYRVASHSEGNQERLAACSELSVRVRKLGHE